MKKKFNNGDWLFNKQIVAVAEFKKVDDSPICFLNEKDKKQNLQCVIFIKIYEAYCKIQNPIKKCICKKSLLYIALSNIL